jgi:excisionase family DNA binding protein
MRYYSPQEVAQITGYHPGTIYRLIDEGKLRANKPGGDAPQSHIRVSEEELRRFMEGGGTEEIQP